MISIIIPTYNEAENIGTLIDYLFLNAKEEAVEIIVSDAASIDNTIKIGEAAGAIVVTSPKKGRAAQMNYGASVAHGDILYFIHADSFPPKTFVHDIKSAIANGFDFGRYRTKFDSNKFILKLNAFFTRFDWFMCYGGDQTLFITKQLFNQIGRFNDAMLIMEDYEIIERAKKIAKYKVMQKDALVSARKYNTNAWIKVQKANYTIVKMYKNGASQQAMADAYKQMLQYR